MAHPHGSALLPMVNEVSNNGGDDDQQRRQQQQQRLLLQQNYLQPSQQIDVRMKRHPEIQPYVPSDRDRLMVSSKGPINYSTGGGSSISSKINAQVRLVNNMKTALLTTKDAKSSSTRPKKCVSMTRLDQLAQPKRDFTRNGTQTTSIPLSQEMVRAKMKKTPRTATYGNRDNIKSQIERKKLESPLLNPEEVKLQSPQKVKIQSSHEKQAYKPKPSKPEQPKPEPPKSEPQPRSQNNSQSIQDSRTTTISYETPSTPTNKIMDQTFDTSRKRFSNTYNVQGSLWDELNGGLLNQPVTHKHKQNNESSIVEQMSDLSTNDRHYQSATSELVQDSESSTNGISYSKDFGSLYNDLEAGLIAEGIVSKANLPEAILEEQHDSPVLLPIDKELLKPLKEDEEKRLKAEEELKELAKREEKERQSRQSIVDSILSRVNQSS